MNTRLSRFLLVSARAAAILLLGVVGFPRPASAAPPDPFDVRVMAEIQAEDPEAADLYQQGNAARDREDHAAASELYERVRVRVPSFFHATRRRCGAELALGHRAEAIALCRNALAAKVTVENQGALATALLSVPNTPADLAEARTLVDRALTAAPNDPHVLLTEGQLGIALRQIDMLRMASAKLDVVAPDDSNTFVLRAILKASEGEREEALAAALGARAHGMPEAHYRQLRATLEGAPTSVQHKLRSASAWLAAWAGAFALLALLGYALSRFMLHVVSTGAPASSGHPHGVEAALRRVYRSVLWLSCAYYYVSIPVVVLVVLAAGGAAILAMLAAGYLVLKLVLVVALVVVGTFIGVLKALFAKKKEQDPGECLALEDHPRFRSLLHEVAREIDTRPVDTVFLTPWTDLAVFDRGGVLRQMRGQGTRCLVVGVGVLDGMDVRSLKSVLAHEYGHFRNEDTAGGSLALSVRRSLLILAVNLARAGVATWYNPAWWFVRGYWKLFLVISQGASRLQEVLADRWAAMAYGSEDFVRGLTHVIERSVRFDAHVKATLDEVVPKRLPLANVYSYTPSDAPPATDVAKATEDALGARPTAYDSHPCPRDRITWVRALASDGRPRTPEDELPAWELFEKREVIEGRMTGQVRERLRAARGVELPAEASA